MISAVVRTKNSAQTLKQCLEGLKAQTYTPTEIIVVDSGSTDSSLEIADQYGCKVVLYPQSTEFNYSKALNLGIEAASSEYILIVSSHVVLKHSNTCELMLSFLTEWNQICTVSMIRDASPSATKLFSLQDIDWRLVNRRNFKGQGMYNFCSVIRKTDWEQYKFNEALPRCEDQDWVAHFYKQNNAGSIVIWNPTVFYSNPYYNARKDAWDYVTLGRYIHPYFTSKGFVFNLLGEALQSLWNRKFEITLHHLTVIYHIVLERLKGISVQSTYNDQHEQDARAS